MSEYVADGLGEERWAVARVFSKRADRIRTEAEKMDCGVSLPIYKRVRYVAGKPKRTERQLLPGYLFVRVMPDDRARIAELDGVYNLLPTSVRAAERLAVEKALMERRAMEGEFNDFEACPKRRYSRRRRRPKPGKRARALIRARGV